MKTLKVKKMSDIESRRTSSDKFRAKFVENNNSILIERWCKDIIVDTKGAKPRWQWWYEIDLDEVRVRNVADMIVHVSQKMWVQENYTFFVELLTLWLSLINIKK